jgi:hypothetical protein
MARPLKEIDERQVELLAGVGCTVDEIAATLGVSDVTLRKRFLPVIEKGREKMKGSLRRKQVERAIMGSYTMLIWLGKNLLGQTDKTETAVSGTMKHEHHDADEETVIAAADAIKCRRDKLPAL